MNLVFKKSHKSITSLPFIDLPNFVVLTGVNGAGKSHLLEAIENGSVQIDDVIVNSQFPTIRRFDWSNLVPQDTGAFAPYQITQEIYQYWNEISIIIKEYTTQFHQIFQQFNRHDLGGRTVGEIISLTPGELTASGTTSEQAGQLYNTIQTYSSSLSQNTIGRFTQNDPINRRRLIEDIQKNTEKPLIAFDENDFYSYFPKIWQPVDMFQQSFSRLFADYQRKWLNNQLRNLANSRGKPVDFLNDTEFREQHGDAPWDFVNRILETAKLDFRINAPLEYEDRPYEPILTDQIRNSQVKFNDLSSGERILMSFALCLYYAGDQRQIVNYPKVLLFDEIDAPLHPSMTQSLLKTIQEVLVNDHGIKVILTTHSPSTVALSAEESLYAMYKIDQDRIQKTTKDKALSILTSGVPTLSINYENRRQVFVESDNDFQFYSKLYEKLRTHLIPDISLNFISSGIRARDGNGNCDKVREAVKLLKNGGNKTVYGIIDWDLTNNGDEHIKVLGDNARYNIESYLLDPILLASLLFRERWMNRSELGLAHDESHTDFPHLSDSKLQSISDLILDKIKLRINPTDFDIIPCKYVGGKTINLPKWFLHKKGHELEVDIKEVFPQLKRFRNEPDLKLEIINKVIDDVPSLIPYDFVDLFKKIQNI